MNKMQYEPKLLQYCTNLRYEIEKDLSKIFNVKVFMHVEYNVEIYVWRKIRIQLLHNLKPL